MRLSIMTLKCNETEYNDAHFTVFSIRAFSNTLKMQHSEWRHDT